MTEIPYAEVIGDPIGHSKSPLIHKFWLKKLGVQGDYRAARINKEELQPYLESRLIDPAWRGCNITLPHKQHAYALIGTMDNKGSDPGLKAYNCVFPKEGKLSGLNTDAQAFIEPLLALSPGPGLAIIIGSGGAARTAAVTLASRGFELEIRARDPGKAKAMLADIGVDGTTARVSHPFPPAILLVNATPLGMEGFPDHEWELGNLPPHAIIYDMVYNPAVTGLIAAGRALGLQTLNGLQMLVGQAAGAFPFFFGYNAPRDYDDELFELLKR